MIFRITTLLPLFLLLALGGRAQQDSPRHAAEQAVAAAERLERAWWVVSNREKAVAEYEKAGRIWRELGDQKQEAATLLRLTLLRLKFKVPSDEIKQTALQLTSVFRALGDAEREALAWCIVAFHEGYNLGAAAYTKYQQLFEQALALARQGATRRTETLVLHSYAVVLSSNSEYEKALTLLDQALPLARELRDLETEAGVNFAYGLTFWRVGDYEKSLAHYEQAHKLYKEYGDFSWATTAVENAALVYYQLEQHERVIESYRGALPFRRQAQQSAAMADNLTSIAAALVQLQRPAEAVAHLNEALDIYQRTENPWGQAWAWRILGEVHLAQGDYGPAVAFLHKSRDLQAKLNEQNGVAKASYHLARTYFAQGRLDDARRQVEELLAAMEGQRASLNSPDLRLAFLAARRDYYELYLEILWRLRAAHPNAGHDLQALEAGERAKARSLFEILSGRADAPAANALEMQNLTDENSALLTYTLGRRASFLFVVDKGGVLAFQLPPADQIELLVQDVRVALSEAGRRHYARFVVAAQRLYEVLLKPAETVLNQKKSLLIAPDAALNYLPFDVLLTAPPPRTGRAEFQKLPFALLKWTISYTPSASVLAEARKRKPMAAKARAGPQFVAFGDPLYSPADAISSSRVRRFVDEVFHNKTLPRLTASGREVTSIAANFGPAAQVFLRQAATEQNVKQSRELQTARIIHFATHGIANERLPQASGLLLSADAQEDGLLLADEIHKLNLQADLVVLSACRTALGRNLRGEGVIGLTRAFLRAGANSVAATLWQVEDAAAAHLMIDFYAQLSASSGKAAALRQAKLAMLKNERLTHPYFWASFVLIGEP